MAISADTPESLRSWQLFFGNKIHFLADPDKKVISVYGLLHKEAGPGGADAARPATFVVNRNGNIIYSHIAGNILDRADPADSLSAVAAEK